MAPYVEMSIPDSLPCATIKQWEEAGASLVAASKHYMDLSLNMGADSFLEGANPRDLISRIDSTLAAVHAAIFRHLEESSSALARTRNRLTSQFFRFPEEIISKIFVCFIYDNDSTLAAVHAAIFRHLEESSSALARTRNRLTSQFFRFPEEIISKIFVCFIYDNTSAEASKSMKQEIWLVYRRLYTLLGVCSVWRNIVTNRGALWSVIPIVSNLSVAKWGPSELCLQRASGSILHLAASTEFPSSRTDLVAILAEHGPRFHTINISVDTVTALQDAIGVLLQHNTPSSLTELRLRLNDVLDPTDGLPGNEEYIIDRDSSQHASFVDLVKNLTILRVYGAHFHWGAVTFSHRLVELWIEGVVLGYDDSIIPFAQALSTAPSLRDLKIISVTTFRRLGSPPNPSLRSASAIVLPGLQSLHLQDLYLNTLGYMLLTIARGLHHLTLFLTPKSVVISTLGREDIEFIGLLSLMRRTSVDALLMDGLVDREWLTIAQLGALFGAMPTLKTLKMHRWSFGNGLCKILLRTGNIQTFSKGPALQNLHLTSAQINSPEGFLHMVSSHPLRQLVLGGILQVGRQDNPLWEDSTFVQWLRGNVPGLALHLVDQDYYPPEFRDFHPLTDTWPLW
ncbi:hypothetical protein RSAG8_09076, partial [Rhizoctonia solani AG-8 WAC10335]